MVLLPVLSVKVNLSVKPSDKGMLFQKNPNHVMQLVYKLYEIAIDVAMMEMQQSLKSGKRFSLQIDEYSSPRHKWYLNINVHQDKDKSLNMGMIAISERMTAEKTVEEVENKLSEFSLSRMLCICLFVTSYARS